MSESKTSPKAISANPPIPILDNEEACVVWGVLHHVWTFSENPKQRGTCCNLIRAIGPMLLSLRLLYELVKDESPMDELVGQEKRLFLYDIVGRYDWVMSRPSVVEHLDHYLQPQSLDLTAKQCRYEMDQLKQEKKETGGLLVGRRSTDPLRSLESYWKMLLIAVKRDPLNGFIKEKECKANLFLLRTMLSEPD